MGAWNKHAAGNSRGIDTGIDMDWVGLMQIILAICLLLAIILLVRISRKAKSAAEAFRKKRGSQSAHPKKRG